MNLLTAFLELRDAVKARDVKRAWLAAKAIGDLIIGVEGFAAGAPDDATKAAYAACCAELEAAVAEVGVENEVGKIGDGQILKLLLDLLLKFGPLFI